MNNDYTCPRCHNVFPSSNKFLHDMRCTDENPMPLDKSRLMQMEPQENSQEENKVKPISSNVNVDNDQNQPRIKEISLKKREDIPEKDKKTIHHAPKPRPPESINLSQSGEFPEIFECEICHETLMLKEKEDHMMCHRMEREEMENLERNNLYDNDNDLGVSQRSIDQQKMIERQIELDNERRRQQNQRSREVDIQRQRELEMQRERQRQMEMQRERQRQREANRNQNNNQQNTGVRVIRGPNGVTIIQQSGGRSNLNDLGMMNDMLPFFLSNTSENSRQRRRMPFDLFSSINSDFNPEDFIQQLMSMRGNRNHDHPTEEQILNNLPETEIDDVTKLDPEKRNCVICLEDFKNGDKATVLPCIHLFHTSCVQSWLKTQNSCPICKFKLTGENLNSQP